MTIRNEEAFNASPAAGFDGPFDWDYLLPVLRPYRGIEPMDHDAVVQLPYPQPGLRLGYLHFLLIESKKAGVPLPNGQDNTLYARALTGFDTILIVWRKDARGPIEWQWWHEDRSVPWSVFRSRRRLSLPSVIIDFVATWARLADSRCCHEYLYDKLREWDDRLPP